jgi:hypothetical protein
VVAIPNLGKKKTTKKTSFGLDPTPRTDRNIQLSFLFLKAKIIRAMDHSQYSFLRFLSLSLSLCG